MRRISGFTLLEMLLAIAIFAVVAVMAHSGLRSVLAHRQHVEWQSDGLQQLQMAMWMIGRDMTLSSARGIRDQFGDPRPDFYSDELGGTVLALTHSGWRNPAALARSELQRVAYVLNDGGLQRWSWQVLDRAQDSEPYRMVLLDGVEAVSLRYLDQYHVWHTQWPPQQAEEVPGPLPLAVEWHFDLRDYGDIRRVWLLPHNPHGRVFRIMTEEGA